MLSRSATKAFLSQIIETTDWRKLVYLFKVEGIENYSSKGDN